MNSRNGAAPASLEHEGQVAALIETLHEAGQRLEELTGSEVDSVLGPDGRSFLLQRAQDQLRDDVAAKQAGILDALPANIALLDSQGTILTVNEAWRRFAGENALLVPGHGIGTNYLEACDRATGNHSAEAVKVAAGLRSVLSGSEKTFSIEYPCHSPSMQRWFVMTAAPMTGARLGGAVVMHVDVTWQRRGEEALLRFGGAMDTLSDGIFLTDRPSMSFVHVNDAACRMQKCTRAELLERGPAKVLSLPEADLARTYDAIIESGVDPAPIEFPHPGKGGTQVWIELRRHALRAGDRWMIVTLARDITTRKESENRIRRLNRVHAVLSGINSLIVRVDDRDELFREAARIAVEQGGFRLAWIGLLDKESGILGPASSAGDVGDFFAASHLAGAHNQPGSLGLRTVRDKTPIVWNDVRADPRVLGKHRFEARGIQSAAVIPLVVADEGIGLLALYSADVGFFDAEEMLLLGELGGDIAFAIDHLDKRERLDYLAYYDALTGLPNRNLLLGKVEEGLRGADAGGHRLALLMVDLERFKSFNDTLGRAAGDALLVQVGQWLKRKVGDASLLAHLGADRFAVVLPRVKRASTVERLLNRMTKEFLAHPFQIGDAVFRIAAKVGVAVYPDDGATADTLFKHAEAALKAAKASGSRYLLYRPNMTEKVAGRLTLENQLRQALDRGEFVLHYQPKMNLASGGLTSVEALIRWNDPATGLVPPGRFIPVLEETGLIHDVGRWALRQAIADHLRWRATGLVAPRIAVNVSPLQLRSRSFVAEIRQIVAADTHAAAGLELEITESLIMEDVKRSIASLEMVRALGVTIAIDDFGTGFSSLSYLAKLPVDTLKIDRSFVNDITTGPEGLALVSTIIELAHSLKLNVVAEGVETEQQSRLLRLLGCDEMQGFLVSKAVPCDLLESRFLGLLPPP